jgi:hypothetical protein
VLEGVALQNASGALEVEGHPGGVIYLSQGQITYAQSEWSPDLVARLRGVIPSASGLQDIPANSDESAGNLGEVLLDRGLITPEELRALLHSVILDALIVLTVPLTADASVAGVRLVAGRGHWASAFSRLNVRMLRAEAVARSHRVTGRPLDQTARLELRDLASGPAVLTSEQWALAGQINGTISARELAWAGGRSLVETLGYVGDLVEAGLCAPCLPGECALGSRSQARSASPAVSELSAGRSGGKRSASRPRTPQPATGPVAGVRQIMPRRKPGDLATSAVVHAAPVAEPTETSEPDRAPSADSYDTSSRPPGTGDNEFSPVPVESLRRVLEGLRRLS